MFMSVAKATDPLQVEYLSTKNTVWSELTGGGLTSFQSAQRISHLIQRIAQLERPGVIPIASHQLSQLQRGCQPTPDDRMARVGNPICLPESLSAALTIGVIRSNRAPSPAPGRDQFNLCANKPFIVARSR